jgi:transposase
LHLLRQLAESQYRHLFYYDESRFTLVSNVPRAWQAPGPTRALPTTRGPGVNVAGFLRHDGTELHAYASTQSVNAADVITFFEDFCQHLTQPTIVVLDNASTHRAAAFQARIPDWETQGLTLYFLPPYSPELNRIELLWRCCKHQWLPFKAYRSIQALTHHLRETLKQVGTKWKIKFA